MRSTIERLSDDTWVPPWIRHQHLTRYEWACQFTAGKTVIDAACGTGYGARILVERGGAKEVLGFDLDAATIVAARGRCSIAVIRFETADATKLPLPDASAEVYASFETIEHVEDDGAFVREAARVLRPGGLFLCSTPNRRLTNPGITLAGKPFNRFHLREYTADEFTAVLQPHFEAIALYGQTPFRRGYAGLLNFVGRGVPMLAVRLHQIRKLLTMPFQKARWHVPFPLPSRREPEVLIAVCAARG